MPPPRWDNRWCCGEIKERPSWGVPLTSRVFGIRAEESERRAGRGRINEMIIRKGRGKELKGRLVLKAHHPIFAWKEWAVWEFIEAQKLTYPSLYDEGFDRIGCIVCPFAMGTGSGAVRKRKISMQRLPGPWKAFEHAVKRWWAIRREKGNCDPRYANETADDYWQSYLLGFEGNPKIRAPSMQGNFFEVMS